MIESNENGPVFDKAEVEYNQAQPTALSTYVCLVEGTVLETDHLQELRDLLGPAAVLLPIPAGKKSPCHAKWNQTSLEDTQSEEYQQRLTSGNVGVLLGEPSQGLCAIDVDRDESVEPFLQLNPLLRASTITRGKRGVQIWVQMAGDYAPLTKLRTRSGEDWGEWRATGGQSVIYGIHPDTQLPYRFLNYAKPVTIAFDQIHWPEELGEPFAMVSPVFAELRKRYGPPYEIGERGGIRINHQWFVQRYLQEHLVTFDPTLKEFYEYSTSTGLWQRQTEDRVKTQFIDDLTSGAHEFAEPGLLMMISDGLVSALTRMLKGKIEKPDIFDNREPTIHLKNGVLRLDREPPELVSFSPEFYSRNQCPLNFNPDALCPRFLTELLGSALDDADISLIQRWSGSCLLGVNLAQRIMLFRGTPGGGKSTLVYIIEQVIGQQNIALLRTDQLAERFETSAFVGRTLLTGKDVPQNFLMRKGASVLKALVGGDLLDVEKKGVNERNQVRGNFNVGITCNSQLKVRLEGDEGAWQRRLMIVDYNKPKPAKPEPGFADRLLKEEGEGILAWMVQGARILLEEIRLHGDFVLSEAQRERVDQLLAESDSVRKFVHDAVECDTEGSITCSDLMEAYSDYCEGRDWDAFGQFDAARKLPQAMYEVHRVKRRNDLYVFGKGQQRGYKGVSLKGE